MITNTYIQTHIEETKELLKRRKINIDVNEFVNICQKYGTKLKMLDDLRHRQKSIQDITKAKQNKEEIRKIKVEVNELFEKKEKIFQCLPNNLAEHTPDGNSDKDNKELRKVGLLPEFSFTPKTHDSIGSLLGILDLKRGAKVSGNGFYYWLGDGAILVNALYRLAEDMLITKGFELVLPPVFAKERTFYGTGYFPFAVKENYKIEGKDLYPIGTSEQTLVALHDNEILQSEDLPRCYTAYTPCFRIEAGSAGKKTRGAFRVHQFHKIEQIIFCEPKDSERWHQKCLENCEELMAKLCIPYRVVRVCVGDMGAPGFKKYDVEAWFPGYGEYRETHSDTNLTDFQAYRFNIKYQSNDGKKAYLHTISSTMATDRIVLAILENFQQEDGSVLIPKALWPYTYGKKVVKKEQWKQSRLE